jgi:hypothetical protein
MWCRQAIRQENTEGKGIEVPFVLKTVFAIVLEMSRAGSHKRYSAQRDPWLWQGWTANGSVKRRAPKNMGSKRALFDGPGGLADRDATLEKFLAQEIEGPAAQAMKEFCNRVPGTGGDIPQPLMRYIAWAAARCLPMRELFSNWVRTNSALRARENAE